MAEPAKTTGVRRLISEWVSRLGFASIVGKTFDGRRDTYEALGYPSTLRPEHFRWAYKRGGIARSIIKAYPTETWRSGGEVLEDANKDERTPFEQAWFDFDQRLKVWQTFKKADTLAQMGRYAVIVIGAPGKLDQPLERATADQIVYLRALGEKDAPVSTWDTDDASVRFGKPIFYSLARLDPSKLDMTASASSGTRSGRAVHHSRVLHVADQLLDDDIYAEPLIEACWNYLEDLIKVVGGGAEAFWKRADGGMQIDVDPDIELTPEAEKNLDDEIDEYVHGLRKEIRTRGVKVNRLGSDTANFSPGAATIIDLISATTRIPQRILMGSERGQLASEQDRSNWDDRIADRRGDFAEPFVVRPFVDRLIELGALPRPAIYTVQWPVIEELGEGEKVTAADKIADINAKMAAIPDDEAVVDRNELRSKYLGLEPKTVQQPASGSVVPIGRAAKKKRNLL